MASSKKHVKPMTNDRKYKDFMNAHRITDENKSDTRPCTNTSMVGGSYHIPDNEYDDFLRLYHRDIIQKNIPEHLTEKQLIDNGPIAIDIDLRYPFDITAKQHTKEHLDDLFYCILDECKKIFQFDETKKIKVFVMEKPNVHRDTKRSVTKDGIHILIGIQCDRITQRILRERLVKKVAQMWDDLPLQNKNFEDIFDEGITAGYTNWTLYGSCKKDCEVYSLTKIYDIGFDEGDDEFCITPIQPQFYDIQDINNLKQLSVRYSEHPSLFLKNDFCVTHNEYKKIYKTGEKTKTQSVKINPSYNSLSGSILANIFKLSNDTERDLLLNSVLEQDIDIELRETYQYVMSLPPQYYEFSEHGGSEPKWIRVGWALKNINERLSNDWNEKLMLFWIVFSSQAKKFSYTDVKSLCEKFMEFDIHKVGGLTKRSLLHWSKLDNAEKYKQIREQSIDHFIELTIQGDSLGTNDKDKKRGSSGDVDITEVLYQMCKDRFVCTSIKNNEWYYYYKNRWIKNENGTTLRNTISDMRDLYNRKSRDRLNELDLSNPNTVTANDANDDKGESKKKSRLQKILGIVEKLSSVSYRNNIMTEAKHRFYDDTFLEKLDQNPYLLCFNNGVFDFKEKKFRKGLPEDCISLCTNIDYMEINQERDARIIAEINEFMHKLFYVDKELERYMWDHLASSLIGISTNQTFNMYIGKEGANGKSKLTKLMAKVLGKYKGDVATTLITGDKVKLGGTCTELLELKGVRYAVMQEASKGEKLNEGSMKLYTSREDIIQVRGLYSAETVRFYPQFNLVVCSNELLTIKSNDGGTWRRIRVVPFLSKFVDEPTNNDPNNPYQFKIDPVLDDKLESWKEVFASMLVSRLCSLNEGKVKDCEIVLMESNKYRAKEDHISQFIGDKIVRDPNGSIKKSELNSEFTLWYQSTYGTRNGPNQREVHEYMDKMFGKIVNNVWKGVCIRYEYNANNFVGVQEEEEEEVNDGINLNDL
jgi:P4 family phage/plasmid primase-like protien